jgi:hypothetical protein
MHLGRGVWAGHDMCLSFFEKYRGMIGTYQTGPCHIVGVHCQQGYGYGPAVGFLGSQAGMMELINMMGMVSAATTAANKKSKKSQKKHKKSKSKAVSSSSSSDGSSSASVPPKKAKKSGKAGEDGKSVEVGQAGELISAAGVAAAGEVAAPLVAAVVKDCQHQSSSMSHYTEDLIQGKTYHIWEVFPCMGGLPIYWKTSPLHNLSSFAFSLLSSLSLQTHILQDFPLSPIPQVCSSGSGRVVCGAA